MSKLLTKVAKGIAFGDVSNIAVRNILAEISNSMAGRITEQEMEETMDFFDWKCPYTGRDLKKSIETQDGSYVTDHIYPQNRDGCGLNVKGNLVIVDKHANSKKNQRGFEEFLLNDRTILGTLDLNTRQKRIDKIKEFQKRCNYAPIKIQELVKSILEERYKELRTEQEGCKEKILNVLRQNGIATISESKAIQTPSPIKGKRKKAIPEIVFHPNNEQLFKEMLIKTKKAFFELTYETGVQKKTDWDASRFTTDSNLRGNIESKTFWRYKDHEGLINVEVFIDYNPQKM